VAKVKALHDRLGLVIQVGFNNKVIKIDNMIVIQVLEGKIQVSWQVFNIVEDVYIW